MPWANGRGTTLEIAAFPAPDAWIWRLSLATVSSDGPFSALAGVDRHVAVAEGAGMVLRINEVEHRLSTYESLKFPGEAETVCALMDGPVRDLNLMVRRSAGNGELRVQRCVRGERIATEDISALVVLDGAVAVATPSPGFPGTPVRERAGRFDAFLVDNQTDDRTHTFARFGSVATAVVASVVALVIVKP